MINTLNVFQELGKYFNPQTDTATLQAIEQADFNRKNKIPIQTRMGKLLLTLRQFDFFLHENKLVCINKKWISYE